MPAEEERLDRRSLLLTAAATAAAASLPPAAGAGTAATTPQADAVLLAAWVRLPFDGPGQLCLASLDAAGAAHAVAAPIPVDLPDDGVAARLQLAGAAAHRAACQAMAGQWRVPAAECGVRDLWLEHLPSGRGIAYRLWVEVVPA
jgi:hypothetical protein